ncbi:hypothetical protein BV25DRAFT_1843321 [Artomyces pyxidatus]|uniref:Uncharacterized protein n=1 Tax=Artomyces pyxidatus TaxID=48021 RepID=A0ACB8SFW0_9AGAM|nr:hypothetical protein BV25DRAFT_1843321 [Artomyces pyxidatus]
MGRGKDKKYFIVVTGRRTGVFDGGWTRISDYVLGYPENSYEGFAELSDALDAWERARPGVSPIPTPLEPEFPSQSQPPAASPSPSTPMRLNAIRAALSDVAAGRDTSNVPATPPSHSRHAGAAAASTHTHSAGSPSSKGKGREETYRVVVEDWPANEPSSSRCGRHACPSVSAVAPRSGDEAGARRPPPVPISYNYERLSQLAQAVNTNGGDYRASEDPFLQYRPPLNSAASSLATTHPPQSMPPPPPPSAAPTRARSGNSVSSVSSVSASTASNAARGLGRVDAARRRQATDSAPDGDAWYAIAYGEPEGVYPGPFANIRRHIINFPGAYFRGFQTIEAAGEWYLEHTDDPIHSL